MPRRTKYRYCGPCEKWVLGKECPLCGADTDKAEPEPCEHCDGCRKLLPVSVMTAVCKQTAKRTHSSPAEYEDVLVCDDCLREDERDPGYERANLRFRETRGSEL